VKKTALLKSLRKIAKDHDATLELARQGKHEIWECEGFTFPIPRHNEIAEGTASAIITGLTNHLENR
jgi:hypothetical protein